jgi:hypothetical protein
VLQDNIDPMTFRTMAKWAEKIFGTLDECMLLKNTYATADAASQSWFLSILQKLNCDTTDLSTYIPTPVAVTTHNAVTSNRSSRIGYISVFAILGWVLFLIALPLKLHYYMAYKKHKKLAKMYKGE